MSTPKDELDDMFEAQRDAGDVMEVDDDSDDMEIEDTDDGGAIIRYKNQDDGGEQPVGEFYTNLLVEDSGVKISPTILGKLASDLLESIEDDIQSRSERDKQYEEGLKRTGIANDTIGGAAFAGASKTVHPMITKAAVDFEARAIKELMPPAGPVKSFIPGEQTQKKLEKAERKTRHMNWQLTEQIPEFLPSLEKILTQVPMAGVQYQRWTWNPRKKRPQPNFVPVDKMIIPYAADDFYTAARRTFREDITTMEFEARVADGIYVDSYMIAISATPPEPTLAQAAADKQAGVSPTGDNRDGIRTMYEVECEVDLSEFDTEAEGLAPYIIRINKDANKIVGVVRNWERDANTQEAMMWVVEWPFIPWRGSMPIGIAQMISGLSAAATGALRALLDSAHINNVPTLLKLKGVGQGGQSVQMEPTQITDLEGAVGVDDIRKLVMAVPFKEPSLVLYQLLGFLVQEAESVVRTTFEDLAEQKQDMPVGTTLALIEQGMAVLSAIHGRLFNAMKKTLAVLHRINKMYITDDQIRNDAGELLARREDYQGPMDVIPVADPRIFSEVQRFAQMQVVADRADKRPELYNQRKVEMMILERLKFPNPEQLLTPTPDAKEMNAVNENVAATLGRPITAFPEQDHLAHIQAHVDYLESPFFGMLQPIAQVFVPAIVQHLIEHMTLWYASRVYEQASAAANQEFGDLLKFKDPETRKAADKAIALASSLAIDEAKEVFKALPDVFQRAMDVIQKLQSMQAPQDPIAQSKIATEQLRGQNQAKIEAMRQQGRAQERAQGIQERLQELNMRVVEGSKDRQSAAQTEQFKETAESMRSDKTNAARIAMNTQDNQTALTIAASEIESGEKIAVSTGTGLNPGARD